MPITESQRNAQYRWRSKLRRIEIVLPVEIVQRFDALADATGKSRAELIRQWIEDTPPLTAPVQPEPVVEEISKPKPVPVDTEPATAPKPQGKPKLARVVDPEDIARLPIPEAYRGGVEASFWVLVEGHKIGLVWKKRVTKTLVWWYSAPLRSRGRLKVPKSYRTRQKALEALIG